MEFLEDESAFFPAGGISPQLPGLDAFPEKSDASGRWGRGSSACASGDEANRFVQALLELVGVTAVVCGSSFPEPQVKH